MSTNDRNYSFRRVLLACESSHEGLSTNNIESGHTEEALGVEDTSILEDGSCNGDGAVDRVRDDEDECLGGELDDAVDECLNNTSVDFEEVVAGHSRFACVEGWSVLLSGQRSGTKGISDLVTHVEFQRG
jgi:hypothetical protein